MVQSLDMEQHKRTEMLLGFEATQIFEKKRVAVFGLGGVGSYCVEALARAGIGVLDITDCDVIDISNLNRQLYALYSTLGQTKVDVAKDRIKDISQNTVVNAYCRFFGEETVEYYDFSRYDYVVDAVDTVTAKLLLAERCQKFSVPLISCMGTGNKFDASKFRVADVFQTDVCPLAKVMRRELKKRNLSGFKVVYSEEKPQKPAAEEGGEISGDRKKRATPGSMPYVPPVAGMLLAGEVLKDIFKKASEKI